jgi:transposase
MKIMHTSSNEVDSPRPTRRYYSPQLKTEVIQQCRQSGASVAGVALAHGINANIVHRWLHEDERAALLLRAQSFMPVTLQQALPVLPAVERGPNVRPDIRVEVHKGSSTITVNWPLEGAASCSAWLREWLR